MKRYIRTKILPLLLCAAMVITSGAMPVYGAQPGSGMERTAEQQAHRTEKLTGEQTEEPGGKVPETEEIEAGMPAPEKPGEEEEAVTGEPETGETEEDEPETGESEADESEKDKPDTDEPGTETSQAAEEETADGQLKAEPIDICRFIFLSEEPDSMEVELLETGGLQDAIESLEGLYPDEITWLKVITEPGQFMNADDVQYIRKNLKSLDTLDLSESSFLDDTNADAAVEDQIPAYALDGMKSLKTVIPLVGDGISQAGDLPVTSIGNGAFRNTGLTGTLYLPHSLETVGGFEGTGISQVVFNSEITVIDNYAFKNCKSLTSIDLPQSLEVVGYQAFVGCGNIKGALTIPGSVKKIDGYAFYQCSGMTSLTVEEGVETIGDFAFYQWFGLTAVPKLPSTLTSIGGSSFRECTNMEGTLTIPENIETIPGSAFQNCKKMKGVNFNDSLKVIAGYAFSGCSALAGSEENGGTPLKLPSGLTVLENNAFDGCTGLTGEIVIPGTIKSIGTRCFIKCSSITSIVLEEGIEDIGDYAFNDCVGITSELKLPSTLKKIGRWAFRGCINVKGNIQIPEGVDTISEAAFYGCANIKRVNFPSGLISIVGGAFSGCKALEGSGEDSQAEPLCLPSGLEFLGDNVFSGCENLIGEIEIPGAVKTIGPSAFKNCKKIETVHFSEGLEEIGNSAFEECVSIKSELKLPATLKSIGKRAFYRCITMEGSIKIPEGIDTISGAAFYGCAKIARLEFPPMVTSIEDAAFSGCAALEGSGEGTQAVPLQLPEKLTYLGSNSFDGCRNLTGNIEIPGTVKNVGAFAFRNCTMIQTVLFQEGTESIGNNAFEGCVGIESELKLPSTLKNIEGGAFRGCTNMTGDIVIPEGIDIINGAVFYNCQNIKTVTFPSTLRSIEGLAFSGCANLTGSKDNGADIPLNLPGGLVKLGEEAFNGCSSLSGKLVIPGAVLTIGKRSFLKCQNITEAVLEEGVESIGSEAFYLCPGLQKVELPSTLKTMDPWAFRLNQTIKSVSYHGSGLTVLGGDVINRNTEILDLSGASGLTYTETSQLDLSKLINLKDLNLEGCLGLGKNSVKVSAAVKDIFASGTPKKAYDRGVIVFDGQVSNDIVIRPGASERTVLKDSAFQDDWKYLYAIDGSDVPKDAGDALGSVTVEFTKQGESGGQHQVSTAVPGVYTVTYTFPAGVKAADGTGSDPYSYTCTLTILESGQDGVLNFAESLSELVYGDTGQLHLRLDENGMSDIQGLLTSSDPSVVKVTVEPSAPEKAVLEAKGTGIAVIKAAYKGQEVSLSLEVTRKPVKVIIEDKNKTYDKENFVFASNVEGRVGTDAIYYNIGVPDGDIYSACEEKEIGFLDTLQVFEARNPNYTLEEAVSGKLAITPREILYNKVLAPVAKVYDGNTVNTMASPTGNNVNQAAFANVLAGDTFTGTIKAQFKAPDVAYSGQTVVNQEVAFTYTSTAGASETMLKNYKIVILDGGAKISPKTLAIEGNIANTKVYDGTVKAEHSNVVISGFAPNESAAVTSVEYGDKAVGSNRPMILGIQWSPGTTAGNYTYTAPKGSITVKTIAISGLSVVDKIYDGTSTAQFAGTPSLADGAVTGDDVRLSGLDKITGSFNSPDAGRFKPVTFQLAGTGLEGADKDNYLLSTSGTVLLRGTIAGAPLTLKPQEGLWKSMGAVEPIFDYGYIVAEGLKGSDTLAGVLRGSMGRETGEAPGKYRFHTGTLNAGSNYLLTFIPSDFEIKDTNTGLTQITYGASETEITGFNSFVYEYNQLLPYSTAQIPVVKAAAQSENARVLITQASAFGNDGAAVIAVTAADGQNTAIYKVAFTKIEKVAIEDIKITDTEAGKQTGTALVAKATGGSGIYEYRLDRGGLWGTGNVMTGLGAGNHIIEVRDQNDKSNTSEQRIVVGETQLTGNVAAPTQITYSPETPALGYTDQTLEITLNCTVEEGAVPIYEVVSGKAGISGNILTVMEEGDVEIKVYAWKDGFLSAPETVTIHVGKQAQLELNVDIRTPTVFNAPDGSLTLLAQGGSGQYQYRIEGGLWKTSNTFTNLISGIYTVYVRDAKDVNNGTSKTVEIINPKPTDAVCVNTAAKQIETDNGYGLLITDNMNLRTSYPLGGREVTVTWQSSHPSIISSEGIVTRPEESTMVTLTAVIRCGGLEIRKTFTVNVLKANAVLDSISGDAGLTVNGAPVSDSDVLHLVIEKTDGAALAEQVGAAAENARFEMTSAVYEVQLAVNNYIYNHAAFNHLIQVRIPYVTEARVKYLVAHVKNDGTVEMLTPKAVSGGLEVSVQELSPFVVLEKRGGEKSGSGDISVYPGEWRMNAGGWWYATSGDGQMWASNEWKLINGRWYRFNREGYMLTGWYFDGGYQAWFYLHPDGGMATGWQQILGKWYYFNPVSDGRQGVMCANKTTPDGYQVGSDGAWIR